VLASEEESIYGHSGNLFVGQERTETGHSYAVFGDVTSHLNAAFLKLVKASFHNEILIQDFPYIASSIGSCTLWVTAKQK
jgi:hypothetical protein